MRKPQDPPIKTDRFLLIAPNQSHTEAATAAQTVQPNTYTLCCCGVEVCLHE